MLGFFPSPIGDELLYSMLARYKARLAGTASLPSVQAAFGETAEYVRVGLPSGLVRFATNLPSSEGMSADDIIDRHTLFPYFSRLLGKPGRERLLDGMKQGWHRGGYEGLGVFRGATHWHRRLNVCTDCLARDLSVHGEAAWRRGHQLPGVFVCSEHGVALRASSVSTVNQAHLVACPSDPSRFTDLVSPFEPETSLRLARASEWLLLNPGETPPAAKLQASLRSLLKVQGWLKANGMARSGLREAVVDHFGRERLASVGIEIGGKAAATDMQRLWGRTTDVGTVPLTLLLLLDYLQADVAGFFQDCAVDDALPEPERRRPRQHPRQTTIARHRATIRTLVHGRPRAERVALRRLEPVAYCHLLQHDREWLESALPSPRQPRAAIDWTSRDRALAERVCAAIDRLRDQVTRLSRITPTRIAAEAGARTVICRNMRHLPQVAELVSRAAETLEQFRQRCLLSAAARFHDEGHVPTWSAFLTRAALKPEHGPQLEVFARQLYSESVMIRGNADP
jgi:hypothetical protein